MTATALSPDEQLERVLSANLGLTRQTLTAFRKENLTRGTDWRYEREVILMQSGLQKISEHFGVGALLETQCKTGVVQQCVFRNQRIIQLTNGEIVRVSSNQNFRKGMEVKYRVEGGANVLDGRTPRFPGRW